MKAHDKILLLQSKLEKNGIRLTFNEVKSLRRDEMILHRWAEYECGSGNAHVDWYIERDETTNKPFLVTIPHTNKGKERRVSIPDREKGALARITKICRLANIHYYHQTDPRGCALYLSAGPLANDDYTRGVAVCD